MGESSTSYSLFSGSSDKTFRVAGGAVARFTDGVVVGSFSTGTIAGDFLHQVAQALAQRCQQLSRSEREFNLSEVTCSKEVNFYFTCDKDARVYIIAVDKRYPARLANQALYELKNEWLEKYASKSLTTKDEGCRGEVKTIVQRLAKSYEDVEGKDQLARIQKSVDETKQVMQLNISQALQSTAQAEVILQKSEELQASAAVFKKQSKDLNNRMWWDQCKAKLMFGGCVVIVLAVIVAVLAAKFAPSKNN